MQYYNLDGYLILINGDIIYWTSWAEYGAENTSMMIDKYSGGVIIDQKNDIAILKPTMKKEKEFDYHSLMEIKKFLQSLPQWDKTKYYIKLEYQGNSDIMDCKTLNVAEDKNIQELRKNLEI
jgi:hydroxymethylpyrimidine pyrophosphatase-like HAD family hydrolase